MAPKRTHPRPGEQHRRPPPARVLRGLGWHEAEVVDLLGDLRDQRQGDTGSQHHRPEVHALPVLAGVGEKRSHRVRMAHDEVHERHDHQHQPQRRRPYLQLGQRPHAVNDQWDDHQGRGGITQPQRDVQAELKTLGHDRAFECEENEGEGREDDVRDDGTVIPEAATPGDQIQVDVVPRCVVGQRETAEHDDHREHSDPQECVPGAIGNADVGADREVREVGDPAERRRRNNPRAPFPVAARGEAERVILQCLPQRVHIGRSRCYRTPRLRRDEGLALARRHDRRT